MSGRQPRSGPEARRALAATLVLVALVLPWGTAAGGPTGRPALGPGSPGDTNLTITIAPADWWLRDGGNVSLAATWAGTPPACTLEPGWTRWSIAPGGAEGSLDPTSGSSTLFEAGDGPGGVTTIVARSTAVLRCGANVTAIVAEASSLVRVAAPLRVSDLRIGPNPTLVGGIDRLQGVLVGGEPPYRLRVDWGDGTVTRVARSASGPFSVAHVYPLGTYRPSLLASDAAGWSAEGAVEEAENVSFAFAGAVVPSAPVAEVGVRASFGVATVHAPPSFVSALTCDHASTPGGGPPVGGPGLACLFDAPGTWPVRFEGVGLTSPHEVATATLDEPVVPHLGLALPRGPITGEVGSTVYVPLAILGGVAPYRLVWALVGGNVSGNLTVSTPGTVYLPVESSVPGAELLSLTATDALGVANRNSTVELVLASPLEAEAQASGRPTPGAEVLYVGGTVTEGAPPFLWAIVPGAPTRGNSSPSGLLDSTGSFAWNGTYPGEGTLPVAVVVVDGVGRLTELNLTARLGSPPTVSAQAGGTGPGSVTLVWTIAGGRPPYTYLWTDSVGERWNGTLGKNGSTERTVPTGARGPTTFDLEVVDALGVTADAAVTVTVPGAAPTPGAPGTGLATIVAGAVVAAAGAGAVVVMLRRFRRGKADPPTVMSDPVAVLRGIVSPADGADRAAVELLAEEHGVPLEVVASTIERLKAEGTLRAERGVDGEEVLTWSDRPAP